MIKTTRRKIYAVKNIISGLILFCFISPAFGQRANKRAKAAGIICTHLPADFKADFNVCDQYQVDFTNTSLDAEAISWDFGDGKKDASIDQTSHIYDAEGIYSVKLVVLNQNGCYDTTIKNFLLSIDKGNLFASKELNVCKNISFSMPGDSNAALNCWSPSTFLNSVDIYDPVCTPLNNINYQYNILDRGANVVSNGNFSSGNTGFSTGYIFDSIINTAGYYFVGPKPKKWNKLYENCFLDSAFLGDTMMIVDGSTKNDVTVWEAIMNVTPNTNYVFGAFAQSLTATDSLVLQVSLNNGEIVNRVRLSHNSCIRKKITTSWFSGSNTSIDIRITNLSTIDSNNNFALDSISLRPISLATDSIHILLIPPPVFTVQPSDTTICPGDSVLLTASGGDVYNWSPAATASQPFTAATKVFPLSETTYKVMLTESTCNITDSLFATVHTNSLPTVIVSKSNDVNCAQVEATLSATGGINYHWQPESTLSDPNIPNPFAEPHDTTMYYVQVTDANGCVAKDSVQVNVAPVGVINYVLPNAFTPNHDGRNDCFGISRWGNVANLDFFIYDRLGNVIFSTKKTSECWDGNYKGFPQPAGTYIYLIKGNTLCGNVLRKGTVVLLR
jgi:gliding motility-associated-like protein